MISTMRHENRTKYNKPAVFFNSVRQMNAKLGDFNLVALAMHVKYAL